MPILSFSMRSQDIDNPSTHTSQTAIKTIKFNQTYKMKYLKLLHIYHNISYTNIHDTSEVSQMANTILFCKISFLNSDQAVYYEVNDGELTEHAGMLCLGETIKEDDAVQFRDTYKVLHSNGILYINNPFTVTLFKLTAKEATAGETDVAVFNATNSHTIEPITASEFRGPVDGPGQFISFVMEYTSDETK